MTDERTDEITTEALRLRRAAVDALEVRWEPTQLGRDSLAIYKRSDDKLIANSVPPTFRSDEHRLRWIQQRIRYAVDCVVLEFLDDDVEVCGLCDGPVAADDVVRVRRPDAPGPMHPCCAERWSEMIRTVEAFQKLGKGGGGDE